VSKEGKVNYRNIILLMFALSGFTALVYELVWSFLKFFDFIPSDYVYHSVVIIIFLMTLFIYAGLFNLRQMIYEIDIYNNYGHKRKSKK